MAQRCAGGWVKSSQSPWSWTQRTYWGPWGHKLQPQWRILGRHHCDSAGERAGDWGGGPVLSLSLPLSCPGAPKGWNNIGLGETLGREYCLAVSIYTQHLHDINTLFHHRALFTVAFLGYKTMGLPFVVPFNPIITRIRRLGQLFCLRLTTWPTWIGLFFWFLVPPPHPCSSPIHQYLA